MATQPANDAPADSILPIPVEDLEMVSLHQPAPAKVSQPSDPYLVAFETPFDPGHPLDWPSGRKWAVTDVLSATGFNRIMVSTIMAPALSTIAREFDMNSAEAVMALSIYLLATAFGPLFIGPLSEMYGRRTILHASNIWFLIWNIVCGFANSKEVLIAARFLAGFGASSIYALAGGVLSDVWRPEQRGKSLGMYLLIPLLGAAVGPIIGGFMAYRTTWRWMFWSTSIFQFFMIIVSFPTFHETYAPVILNRRAKKLRRETGDSRYYTLHERVEGEKTVLTRMGYALSRPLRLLAFHPVIQIASLISGFYYGILYIVLSSFSDLWVQQYGFSVELSGLHYLACALGELAGSQLGGPVLDAVSRRFLRRNPGSEIIPESRIPLIVPGSVLSTLGLFVYGWTAQYRVHWIAVDVGVFTLTFGMQLAGLPLQAYVIDAYPEHTSSAMAATQFLKSLTAFLFPLFMPSMYKALGYGWGNSALAFVGLIFRIPLPLILWKFGGRMRANRATY